MADISQPAFDLQNTYVHLEEGGAARHVPVPEDFWTRIQERTDLCTGRLVTALRMSDDWPTWEMHPSGDELVILLSGSLDLTLKNGGGERTVELRGRGAYLIPRGTWHTARLYEPCEMLFITPGAGTQNRPL